MILNRQQNFILIKIAILLISFLLILMISACPSPSSTAVSEQKKDPDPENGNGKWQPIPHINLITNQNAIAVIGQVDFDSGDATDNVTSNNLGNLYGNPLVVNDKLFLPDTYRHRVLVFNTVPAANDASADYAIGQPDFDTADINRGGPPAGNTLNVAQTVSSDGKRLLITDWANNRVLLFNSIPSGWEGSADVVIGQSDFTTSNATTTPNGLRESESTIIIKNKVIIADSGNNRVLIFNTIPTSHGAEADIVLGQGDFTHNTANDDNQDGGIDLNPTARTLNFPSDIWSDGSKLVVCDANNNRVLIWNSIPDTNFQPADLVVGQPDMNSHAGGCDASSFSFPYFLTCTVDQLLVCDQNNNRVLVWNTFPTENDASADVVLGQADFNSSFPATTQTGMQWPQGITCAKNKLFVMDAANNRCLIFEGN